MCSSRIGLFFGGRIDDHIIRTKVIPEIVAILIPIPKIKLNPISSRPAINKKSIKPLPARLWWMSANGPLEELKKPLVGEPPLNQELLQKNSVAPDTEFLQVE